MKLDYGTNNPVAYSDECQASPTKLHKWIEAESLTRRCLYVYKCMYCDSVHKVDSSD